MKIFSYLLLFFIQISLNLATNPVTQYKCSLWNNACLVARAQAIIPILAAGISDLGTERLEPMFIDFININQEGLKFDMRNVVIQGLREGVIDNISVDVNSRLMRLVFHADFSIKSQYTAGGYLFSMPFIGQGDSAITYKNVLVEMSIAFEVIKDVYGRNAINLKGYQYWYDVRGGGQLALDNLYYGDKKSSDRMHVLLNQNWKPFSIQYGRHIFDKINDKIFNALRTYIRSQSLDNISLY